MPIGVRFRSYAISCVASGCGCLVVDEPNRAYWCQYLEDWVAVKQRFELAMDQAEEDAVSRGLDVCGLYRIRDHLDGRHEPEP